ncbi:morphogenetic protein [Candidatus Pantoea formicae]|uniref:morphogenetic protein n=1 Tax=Candidatus Pantoea formicae TaxID=2608355 RepID=UPI003EDAFECE
MKERPIIFNSVMVRAVMEGRKVQTRRVVKFKPREASFNLNASTLQLGNYRTGMPESGYVLRSGSVGCLNDRTYPALCPYGAVGDRLWVRETWQGPLFDEEQLDEFLRDTEPFYTPKYCQYAADGGPKPEYCDRDDNIRYGWRPSIHMPRWASRITLEITGVRVERLQDISEADAAAEGIKARKPWSGLDGCIGSGGASAKEKFETLWESIYGEGSWQANPWVWVIEFKRVEGQ